jgi:hypothetical protein
MYLFSGRPNFSDENPKFFASFAACLRAANSLPSGRA